MQVESKSPEPKKMRVGQCAVNRVFGHPDRSRGNPVEATLKVSRRDPSQPSHKATARQATALGMASHRDPFPASPRFHDNNPVSLQRADQLSLLFAQNTRKNQPLSAL